MAKQDKGKAKKEKLANLDITLSSSEVLAQYDPNTGKILLVGAVAGSVFSDTGEYHVSGKYEAKIKAKDTVVTKVEPVTS